MFKEILLEFVETKGIVVIDLISEYTKHMKKVDAEKQKVDLEANLIKTIAEYENMLKHAEDEQQKQKIEKLLIQMKKELKQINKDETTERQKTNVSISNELLNNSFLE